MGFSSLTTPVVLLVFKRPEHTQQVFDAVARAQPKTLFVVADGPRTPEEAQLCQEVREIVARVDWDCDVHHNFAENNMGLKARISSGLNWVFEQTDTAIILEDDCVPHPTFFRYCEELLDKYRHEERVMHISGDNFGYQRAPGITDSYYFSRYAHVWGWATWRRAWQRYKLDATFWRDKHRQDQVLRRLTESRTRDYWKQILGRIADGSIATWDFPWAATCLLHDGICAMPYENQIANIGIGGVATNTMNARSPLSNLLTSPISFPLHHPLSVEGNQEADRHAARLFWNKPSLLKRMGARLFRLGRKP